MRQREKAPNKQKTKSTVPSRPVPYRTEPHLQTRHFSRTRENIWTRRHVLDLGLVGLLGGLVRGGAEGGSVFFSPVFFSSLSFFPFLFSKFISTGERGTMRTGDGDGLGRGRGGRRRGWELGVFAWRKPVKERTEDSLFFFFFFPFPSSGKQKQAIQSHLGEVLGPVSQSVLMAVPVPKPECRHCCPSQLSSFTRLFFSFPPPILLLLSSYSFPPLGSVPWFPASSSSPSYSSSSSSSFQAPPSLFPLPHHPHQLSF